LITVNVKLPPRADLAAAERLVESTCRSRGLSEGMKTTLRSYPGSIHWHFTKEGERGTIEVTLWKKEKRLWINVHDNRASPWTSKEAGRLKSALEGAIMKINS